MIDAGYPPKKIADVPLDAGWAGYQGTSNKNPASLKIFTFEFLIEYY